MMIQWSMSSHFHYHSHPGLVSGNWPKPLLCKSPRTPPWRTAIRSYSEWSAHVVTTLTQLCRDGSHITRSCYTLSPDGQKFMQKWHGFAAANCKVLLFTHQFLLKKHQSQSSQHGGPIQCEQPLNSCLCSSIVSSNIWIFCSAAPSCWQRLSTSDASQAHQGVAS